MNLYAYAGGDPVNRSDPSGLLPNWLEKIHAKFRADPPQRAQSGFTSTTIVEDWLRVDGYYKSTGETLTHYKYLGRGVHNARALMASAKGAAGAGYGSGEGIAAEGPPHEYVISRPLLCSASEAWNFFN